MYMSQPAKDRSCFTRVKKSTARGVKSFSSNQFYFKLRPMTKTRLIDKQVLRKGKHGSIDVH